MPESIDKVFRDAQSLQPDEQAILAERLVQSLVVNMDPEISAAHIAESKSRLDAVRSGDLETVDGKQALDEVRGSVNQ